MQHRHLSDRPVDTRDSTVIRLASKGFVEACTTARGILSIAVLALTLLCANALWAVSSGQPNLISSALSSIVSIESALGAMLVILTGLGIVMHLRADRPGLRLVLTALAYLTGVGLYRWIQTRYTFPEVDFPFQAYTDVQGALFYRSIFLLPVLPLLLVYWTGTREEKSLYPLRFGNLKTRGLVFFRKGGTAWSWWCNLGIVYLLVILPVFLMMQMQVSFEPILSGKWLIFLPGILLLALFNALAEDLIIIGLIMPVVHRYIGTAGSVLLIALFFGLLHWGSAPSAIAGLPQGLGIAVFVLVAAKSANEVRGIGWSVLVHMGADIAIFSAHFI